MEFLSSIWIWALVVLLFGLAIFVHELGHFLAARLLGFQVDAFSIGFGPAIWQKKVNGTVYKIAWLPLGGYVALPQLDPSGMDKLQGGSSEAPLPEAAPWKRIVVSVAGPFGNVVLAVLLAVLIWLVPWAQTGAISTDLGFVSRQSQAYEAGLRDGDKLLTIAGKPAPTWEDFRLECHLAGKPGEKVRVEVQRGNEVVAADCVLAAIGQSTFASILGISPAGFGDRVTEVSKDSPAEAAGLQVGDVLLSVDGRARVPEIPLAVLVALAGEKDLTVEYLRNGELRTAKMRPVKMLVEGEKEERLVIGIMPAPLREVATPAQWMRFKNPGKQLKSDAASIVRVLEALVTPKSKGESGRAAKALGGPVLIAKQLQMSLDESFWSGLGFLRLLCINLAIINLLPLPVLDGGHILFALYEMIFRRKVPKKAVEVLVNAFAILLIGLMLLLVYRDVNRLVPSSKKPAPQVAVEAEQPVAEQP